MKRISTPIPELMLLEPTLFEDARGYFFESYNKAVFDHLYSHPITFVQDNESASSRGVVRGLHYQMGTAAQGKLVRVVKGCVLDVAVDIRRGSPTFGRHFAIELSDANKRQLFIPRGFAHGFSVLSREAVFQYKCDNLYNPTAERGIAFNDEALDIDWRINGDEICLSPKDLLNPCLSDAIDLFDYYEPLY